MEISALESRPFHWLTFQPEVETHFEVSTAAERARRILIEGIICGVIFNLFALSDYFLFGRSFSHSLEIRLGFATPFIVVSLFALRTGHLSAWARESLIALVCIVFSTSVLFLYFGSSAVVSAYALFDLMLIVLFTNVGIRIRFSYGLVATAISVAMGCIYVLIDPWLTRPEKLESLAVLIAGAGLSLIANHSAERSERMNFLLRIRSAMQTADLVEANGDLLQIAYEDKLTGIANRRRFDKVYEIIWENSIATGTAISVIMIDIDKFKNLNDLYGHTNGDAVLTRVAILLREDLRIRGDFVARYGGEEFIAVLTNSSDAIAHLVAERLRSLIETAASPVRDYGQKLDQCWATISCGVATGQPGPSLERNSLIAQADQALYRAKADGRNRVRYSP